MIKKLSAILTISLVLAGCGDNVQKIEVSAKPIEIDIAKTADPEAVKLSPIHFKVVTKSNLNAFIAEIGRQQNTADPVFIAITTKDYENLSLNLADLHRYIEQQQSVIVYYRNLTNHSNNSSTTATSN